MGKRKHNKSKNKQSWKRRKFNHQKKNQEYSNEDEEEHEGVFHIDFEKYQELNQSQTESSMLNSSTALSQDDMNINDTKFLKEKRIKRNYTEEINKEKEKKDHMTLHSLINKLSVTNFKYIIQKSISLFYQIGSKVFLQQLITVLQDHILKFNEKEFILLYSSFIVSLNNCINTKIGKYFLKYLQIQLNSLESSEGRVNIIMLLGHLYNLDLFTFDVIYFFFEQILLNQKKHSIEHQIELIYKLFLSCGYKIRDSDESRFISLIDKYIEFISTQSKTNQKFSSFRYKFMNEWIEDMKNKPKITKTKMKDQFDLYHFHRKLIHGIQKTLKKIGNFQISMPTTKNSGETPKSEKSEKSENSKMEIIIKQQKDILNTDLKILIFKMIFSSSSIDECISKFLSSTPLSSNNPKESSLIHINLRENHREIFTLLIHFAILQKSTYSTFYYSVISKLWSLKKKKYSRIIQFILYNFWTNDLLHYTSIQKIKNLIEISVCFIRDKIIHLAALKIINFDVIGSTMNESSSILSNRNQILFWKSVFIKLIITTNENLLLNDIFLRLMKNLECEDLQKNLLVFFEKVFFFFPLKKDFHNYLKLNWYEKRDDVEWLSEKNDILGKNIGKICRILKIEYDPLTDQFVNS